MLLRPEMNLFTNRSSYIASIMVLPLLQFFSLTTQGVDLLAIWLPTGFVMLFPEFIAEKFLTLLLICNVVY